MILSPFSNPLEGAICGAAGALLRLGYEFVASRKAKGGQPIPAGWWTTVSATWLITAAFIGTGTLAATLIASSMPLEHLPVVLRPVWAGIGYFFRINRLLPILREWSPWRVIGRVAGEYMRWLGQSRHGESGDNGPLLPQELPITLRANVTTKIPRGRKWISTDPEHRLSLTIGDSVLTIEERQSHTAFFVTKDVKLRMLEPGHCVAERETDDDVLLFLGIFDPDVRDKLLASEPAPSVLELRSNNHTLHGTWMRILARKAPGSDTEFVLYKARKLDIEFVADH